MKKMLLYIVVFLLVSIMLMPITAMAAGNNNGNGESNQNSQEGDGQGAAQNREQRKKDRKAQIAAKKVQIEARRAQIKVFRMERAEKRKFSRDEFMEQRDVVKELKNDIRKQLALMKGETGEERLGYETELLELRAACKEAQTAKLEILHDSRVTIRSISLRISNIHPGKPTKKEKKIFNNIFKELD